MTEPVRPKPILYIRRATIPMAVLFFYIGSLSSSASSEDLSLYAFEQPHMGTLFRIKLYAQSKKSAQVAATAAFQRIEELNSKLSDYLPQSELNQLAASPSNKPIPVSIDLYNVLDAALTLAKTTNGSFDPTIGYASNLWRRSLRKGLIPSATQIVDAKKHSGYQNVTLDAENNSATLRIEGMFFDLGGIAKGFAADEALKVLAKHHITRAAIAAGGDVRVGAPPPHSPEGWEIPVLGMNRTEEEIITTVMLKNGAISTSGDREQFVEIDGTQYAHIINPNTGLGLTHRVTATVIAPTATQSDALATALCILGRLNIDLPDDTYALLITHDSDGTEREQRSPGFPDPPA